MELSGEVLGIIYQNELNSYTIAEMYADELEKVETIVGYLPFITEGDNIKVIGKFVEHKDYGEQFKVDYFEKIMPKTLDALERYLANGTIKGVGKATARKIVAEFGETTIDVIRNDPIKLARIRGITTDRAFEISESFIESWEVWQIVRFLEKFNIGIENSKRIFDKLGVTAINQIEEDPYILIDLARGVDFRQIDKMALDLGIDKSNLKRIKSGIKYALIQTTYKGNSCIILQNLEQYVINLLNVSLEEVEEGIINLKAKGEIVIEERDDDTEWVYLESFYNTEQAIVNRLMKLTIAQNSKEIKDVQKEINKFEKLNNITLSEKQKESITLINEQNVVVITGGPGTGKTTIIKAIIEIYNKKKDKVVLAAPTGRAAKRMTEVTGSESSTLHRLLEIGKIDEDGLYKKVQDYQGTPIDGDVVIIDEMSMVDMFLMNCLLQSIYQGTKLILVGDSDQLPSVGPGSILQDIIQSGKITTVHLDKIFRQAAKSKIIVNAHRVNEGKFFIPKDEMPSDSKQDFFFINEFNQEKILNQIISLCTGRLKNFGDYDFYENIQILTPTKKGMLGTKELNKFLQQALNPHDSNKKEKSSQGAVFRVGDRIMQIKNNYDIYWEKSSSKESGSGVFNGEFGTIIDINEKDKNVEIKFDDDKVALYEFSDLDQIEHSYSITIHKAQRQ